MGAAAVTAALFQPCLANFFGGWEVVLVLAVVLILWSAQSLRDGRADRPGAMLDGLRRALEILRHNLTHASPPASEASRPTGDTRGQPEAAREWILWLAQGFDLGRVPWAPGTFGSVLGLVWFFVLLVPASLPLYLAGTALGLGVSVWACGIAEKMLGETDPPSVVLDEVVVLPVCFLPWVWLEATRSGALPGVDFFLSPENAWRTALVFALFRGFDVLKPWPVRQSQVLPGGWGITIDDLLAAGYVAVIIGCWSRWGM